MTLDICGADEKTGNVVHLVFGRILRILRVIESNHGETGIREKLCRISDD
jgi:hypothetical protein